MANILIIDDDKFVCDAQSRLFRKLGHDVTCALPLAEGVKKARQGAYDVVFLDVIFPEGSGLDVLPQIKQAPSAPEVIIISRSRNGSPRSGCSTRSCNPTVFCYGTDAETAGRTGALVSAGCKQRPIVPQGRISALVSRLQAIFPDHWRHILDVFTAFISPPRAAPCDVPPHRRTAGQGPGGDGPCG